MGYNRGSRHQAAANPYNTMGRLPSHQQHQNPYQPISSASGGERGSADALLNGGSSHPNNFDIIRHIPAAPEQFQETNYTGSVGGYPSSVVSPGDPLAVTSKPGVQADVDGVQLIYTTATAAGPQSAPENEQSQTDQQLFHSTKF